MVARPIQRWYRSPRQVRSSFQPSSQRQGRVLGRPRWRPLSFHNVWRRLEPEPFEYSVLSRSGHSIFQIWMERLILGVLGPQQSVTYLRKQGRPIGRHFAQCPAEGFKRPQMPCTEAVSLDPQNRKLGRSWTKAGAKKGSKPRVKALESGK